MKKALTTVAAGALALGLVAGAPAPASAHPLLWAWVLLAGAGGLTVGYLASNHDGYVQPAAAEPAMAPGGLAPGCHWARARVEGGWHRVQVCD